MAITEECRAFLDGHFKLENYLGTADLPLKKWSVLFSVRDFYDRWFGLNGGDGRNRLEEALRDPLAKTQPDEYWDQDFQRPAVKELDYLDYYRIHKRLPLLIEPFEELESKHQQYLALNKSDDQVDPNSVSKGSLQDFCRNYLPQFNDAPWLDKNVTPLMNHGFLNVGNVDISIDMDFPDDVLKSAFDDWLKDKREKSRAVGMPHFKRTFNDTDMAKWDKFQTLQYQDLMHVARFFNCKLSDVELGHYLFKLKTGYVDVRGDMRTVRIHGDKMSNSASIAALEGVLHLDFGNEHKKL